MYLDEVVLAHKQGVARGIPSICSAHPDVLREALKAAQSFGVPPLIEATCNQVNQFGGYTGMRPADFVQFLQTLARQAGFPFESLILGGDHLGPSPWQAEPAEHAMRKSLDLVQAYVQAGFTKIHLDCSMRLADDPPGPPDPALSARRAARLASAAESCASQSLRYVIGTEVPIPGGAQEVEGAPAVTSPESAKASIELSRQAFLDAGLASAWERVLSLVVQPGVEFGDDFVAEYDPLAAQHLSRFIEAQPLVYEAHSTDYQSLSALRALVQDHFAILKVGPGLTFAYRAAVFALAQVEEQLVPRGDCSHLLDVIDAVMLDDPRHWSRYYHGTAEEQAHKRRFSLSDRIRYYWPDPRVQAALARLFTNMQSHPIPSSLLDQFAPGLASSSFSPSALISASIQNVLHSYHSACQPA